MSVAGNLKRPARLNKTQRRRCRRRRGRELNRRVPHRAEAVASGLMRQDKAASIPFPDHRMAPPLAAALSKRHRSDSSSALAMRTGVDSTRNQRSSPTSFSQNDHPSGLSEANTRTFASNLGFYPFHVLHLKDLSATGRRSAGLPGRGAASCRPAANPGASRPT